MSPGLLSIAILIAPMALAAPGLSANAQSVAYSPGHEFQDCLNCPGMVVIPPGRFIKGSPPGEALGEGTPPRDAANETPQKPVSLGAAFAVSVTEITRAQFSSFVVEKGYDPDSECITWNFRAKQWGARGSSWSWSNPGFGQGPDHPVVCVSFIEAQAYVRWLAEETGKPYRLLTDEEWEYVARDRTQAARPWDRSDFSQRRNACAHANVMDLDTADYLEVDSAAPEGHFFPCRDGYPLTAPVGSFSANSYGVYDMLGNAWEWVNGCMYTVPEAGQPAIENCNERLIRGGAWQAKAWYVRSAKRDWAPYWLRSARVGLRVARDLSQ